MLFDSYAKGHESFNDENKKCKNSKTLKTLKLTLLVIHFIGFGNLKLTLFKKNNDLGRC